MANGLWDPVLSLSAGGRTRSLAHPFATFLLAPLSSLLAQRGNEDRAYLGGQCSVGLERAGLLLLMLTPRGPKGERRAGDHLYFMTSAAVTRWRSQVRSEQCPRHDPRSRSGANRVPALS